jgi:hypothetical protein
MAPGARALRAIRVPCSDQNVSKVDQHDDHDEDDPSKHGWPSGLWLLDLVVGGGGGPGMLADGVWGRSAGGLR